MDDAGARLAKEAARLAAMVDEARPGMPVADIVGMYHQAMSVSALLAALGDGAPDGVGDAEAVVSRFDSEAHPSTSRDLDCMISSLRKSLESGGPGSYDELRKLMSTREFVGQYERIR